MDGGMMNVASLWTKYSNEITADPLLVLALTAALIALATTPIAFAVLGRREWFKARRGRVMQRPEFSSIVAAMILVMAIPAIFSALVLKSRYFDKNRYEFDPNRTWSVLEQGRGLGSLEEADAAVKSEMQRLAEERKNLVNNVKKLDEAMLALRAVAGTSAPVAQAFPTVLQSLAGVRRSVGLDGPQQLLDYTAPPVELKTVAGSLAAPAPATLPVTASAATLPAGQRANGLAPTQLEAELAAVPDPQKGIAAMLPLTDLPPGWTAGKSGNRYIETFNAENLYEKIDGRAESFLQYGVKGMAYSFYHPIGDPSNELQLYVFEMADSLKALGKYGSEKPDEAKTIAVGSEGYTAAGSTLFYAGKYYNQIVSTQDDPKFAACALELAKRVASEQKPGEAASSAAVAAAYTHREGSSSGSAPNATASPTKSSPSSRPGNDTPEATGTTETTPESLFRLLPTASRQGDAKYVAQDVFGYSFLSDIFMADYKDGDVTWQGFLRPYRDDKEAKEVLEKYKAGVKQDGAEVKTLQAEGADEMIMCSSIGLFDVVFRKGNTLAGANGATTLKPAESFARTLARSLPNHVQAITSGK
jgi:hypothetical protein